MFTWNNIRPLEHFEPGGVSDNQHAKGTRHVEMTVIELLLGCFLDCSLLG